MPKKYYQEIVLLSIKIYQDGLVEVSPALSKIINEPHMGLSLEVASEYSNTLNPYSTSSTLAYTLFMNDFTVITGIKKGFSLSSIRIKAESGKDYDYVIFNLKEVLVPQKLEGNYKIFIIILIKLIIIFFRNYENECPLRQY